VSVFDSRFQCSPAVLVHGKTPLSSEAILIATTKGVFSNGTVLSGKYVNRTLWINVEKTLTILNGYLSDFLSKNLREAEKIDSEFTLNQFLEKLKEKSSRLLHGKTS
jgi:hypothetical protein